MKKIFLVILLFSCKISFASHLMGGDIKITRDSNGAYWVHVKHFRDVSGVPANSTLFAEIFSLDTATNVWQMAATQYPIPMDMLNSNIPLPTTAYGIEEYNYVAQIPVGGYLKHMKVVVTECCRNHAILNLAQPSTESFSLIGEYIADTSFVDNTPEFLALPIMVGPVNSAWVYNPLPYDADGDSIVWALNTPISTVNPMNVVNCVGYVNPSADTSGPFTLNAVNGEVTWTPNLVGNHVASFAITEYRNGTPIGSVIRDMQYVVVPDSSVNGPKLLPSYVPSASTPYQTNTGNKTNYINYSPGQALNFELLVADGNADETITTKAFSELLLGTNPNATFTTTATGLGNQLKLQFYWNAPITETTNKKIVFRTFDGTFYKDFTLLLIKTNAPNAIKHQTLTVNNVSIQPNPSNGNINISLQSNETLANNEVKIMDISGKIVNSQNITITKGSNLIPLQLKLNSGLYVMQIVNKKGMIAVSKLVIN